MLLDHGVVRNDGFFDHHHNAITDAIAFVFVVGILHMIFVDDLDVLADANILVNDGAADNRVFTNAHWYTVSSNIRCPFGGGRIVVTAHHQGVFDGAVGINAHPNPHNGVGDVGLGEGATFAHDGVFDIAVVYFAGGQISGSGENRCTGVIQIKCRLRVAGEIQIRLIERFDGPDVFPIAVIEVGLDIALANGLGDNFLAEVRMLWVLSQQLDHGFLLEDVDPHRSQRHALVARDTRRVGGLFDEGGDEARGVERRERQPAVA